MKNNYSLFLVLLGSLTTAMTSVYAKSNVPAGKTSQIRCLGEKDDDWVQSRMDALTDETLYRFAIKQAGPPTSCKAKITETTDEGKFGTLVYQFTNGTTYAAESLPPETSVITLSTINGFIDTAKVIEQVKMATQKTGLQVDWSKPNVEKSGDTETKTFWDPHEGTNGRGFLSYRKGKLVSVGFGMAL